MYPTSQTETKTTRPRPGRPNTAPPYYPARPASVWITALHGRPPADPERLAGGGNTIPPEGNTR